MVGPVYHAPQCPLEEGKCHEPTLFVHHAVLLAACLLGTFAPQPAAAQQGTIRYESQPDAAALYLGDLAYLRDELAVPAGMEAAIVLPATALRDSLRITEDGGRLPGFRYLASDGPEGAPVVTWDPPPGDSPRQVVLEYLATGAGWQPLYDMDVLQDGGVQFGFDALIHNTALPLDGADIRLVAAMPGAEPGYQPQATVTQMNVGYAEASAAVAGGPLEILHVYEIGSQRIPQGAVLCWSLVYQTLEARRLLVWDARLGQRVDVIYKVFNSTDTPFVSGPVRAYQDGLYVGQDHIEWTPSGGEGSVTVAGLSDLRVRRTESVEALGGFRQDERYRHTVRLEITNHGGEDVALTVLDEWNRAGTGFSFSHEPQRQGNNVLRWELSVPAGEQMVVQYTFVTD